MLVWKSRESNGTPLPDNLISSLPHADTDIFPNIRVLIEIGCIFPVSSAEAERSFSVLRRIKTHLRNCMKEDRLASLTLMNINAKLAINPDEIVDRYIKRTPEDSSKLYITINWESFREKGPSVYYKKA